MATIYPASDETISLLSGVLLKGEIVGVPTETVYGLAAHAFDEEACARVFQAKARPSFDPLIVHLPIDYDLSRVAIPNPAVAQLAAAFWPGPLTLVLPKNRAVPGIVTSGLDSVAIRIPRHPVFQRLLRACSLPLAAPSANPFGYVSPTTAHHVDESLGDRIRHILDGGPCEIGLESTIVDLRDPAKPVLLRPGAITADQIAAVLETPVATAEKTKRPGEVMPGQLERHYSPRSTCRLCDRIDPEAPANQPGTAFLFFRKPNQSGPLPPNVFWLSETGDDLEAGARLFDLLRSLDRRNFTAIVAEKAPPQGLGFAINDRLTRAASRET